jgi:hypothetical protein
MPGLRAMGVNIQCPILPITPLFQQMKKYPLKQAEIDKYVTEYGNDDDRAKAVQPHPPTEE